METPFSNDMFALVFQAFKKLYPDKECECQWVSGLADGKEKAFGATTFADDGKVYVAISAEVPAINAAEVFAHELAHVAVGDDAGHGQEWEEALSEICNEYERILEKIEQEEEA